MPSKAPSRSGKYVAGYNYGEKYLVYLVKDEDNKRYWYYNGECEIYGVEEWNFDDWREVQ